MQNNFKSMNDMQGKTCMITGGNSGIGFATALGLARMHASVVIVCRNSTSGESTLRELVKAHPQGKHMLLTADLSDLQQVRTVATQFIDASNQLDVLINNAAVFTDTRQTTTQGLEMQFGVNYLAHVLLTQELMKSLLNAKAGRVINTGSISHYFGKIRFDDLQLQTHYDGLRAYNQSKLAMVLFTTALANKLRNTTVTVNTADPGRVNTGLGNKNATGIYRKLWELNRPLLTTTDKGAATNLYLASSPEVEHSNGNYFRRCKTVWSLPRSRNLTLAEQLWQVSETLIGQKKDAYEFV